MFCITAKDKEKLVLSVVDLGYFTILCEGITQCLEFKIIDPVLLLHGINQNQTRLIPVAHERG